MTLIISKPDINHLLLHNSHNVFYLRSLALIRKTFSTRKCKVMKKILFACDGKNFSEAGFDFIKWLSSLEPVKVTGVFFASVNYQMLLATAIGGYADAYIDYKEDNESEIKYSIGMFERGCKKNEIEYRIHRETEFWNLDEIAKETRFADLLVISSAQFRTDFNYDHPNSYLKQTIHSAECPVIVVPDHFEAPSEILLAYDGKKDSLYAMKQFCYLFPELTRLPANIVYIKDEDTATIPSLGFLSEYAACHFSELNIEKMHFAAKTFFPAWAAEEKNKLVVTGSYGRSGISGMLSKSFAEEIIRNNNLPVFIAHQN